MKKENWILFLTLMLIAHLVLWHLMLSWPPPPPHWGWSRSHCCPRAPSRASRPPPPPWSRPWPPHPMLTAWLRPSPSLSRQTRPLSKVIDNQRFMRRRWNECTWTQGDLVVSFHISIFWILLNEPYQSMWVDFFLLVPNSRSSVLGTKIKKNICWKNKQRNGWKTLAQ